MNETNYMHRVHLATIAWLFLVDYQKSLSRSFPFAIEIKNQHNCAWNFIISMSMFVNETTNKRELALLSLTDMTLAIYSLLKKKEEDKRQWVNIEWKTEKFIFLV